jgi:transcriptional regulator GlxA family with amidase domain
MLNASARRLSVAIVVPPNAQSLDVSGPMDALLEANRQSGGDAGYELSLISMNHDRTVRVGSMSLLADTSIFDDDQQIDTLLVAGTPDYYFAYESLDLHAWLRRTAPLTRRRCAVGTGAFFLGAAGLLNGMKATTHWQHTAELAARCPRANILTDHIYVEDQALYTSAGVTAGIDLALKLIEGDHGRELARKVAHRLVASLKRSGQRSQFSNRLASQNIGDERIQAVRDWVLNHLSLDLTLESLAARAGMGVRHFGRLFARETGTTPGDFVESAKVDAAKKLIETTNIPLNEIAVRCGFANANVMRCTFMRRMGVRPSFYRKKYRMMPMGDRRHVLSDVRVNY